jgi:hypothetical protein
MQTAQSPRPRRRRVMVAALVTAGACAALTVAGVMSANAATRPASTTASRPAKPPASSAPSAPAPAPDSPAPAGAVVPTGIRLPGGEVVLYAVAINEQSLPGIHFGVMAGQRDAAGRLTARVESNEVTGSDRAAGFHAVQAATEVDGVRMPEFGYYAGPAAKITARAGGRQIQARQARWSQDPGVVLFWFDPADMPAGQDPTHLAAFDAAGHRLPAGNPATGHG